MNSGYQNSAIRELRDQQVRFAPRDKKIDQANRAEKLLAEIEPKRVYPYDFLCYRITDYRPESHPDVRVSGEQARHDLQLLVEDLSESAGVAADQAGEPVMTVEELSKQFHVSTKTIGRWRDRGLVGRRFMMNGRKRLGFLKSSVDRFVRQNEAQIERSSRFTQLTPVEREEIVTRARRLAAAGACPAEVTQRLARHLGRSPETIRYTLKQHDRDNPLAAVFPDQQGPLSEVAKQEIFEAFNNRVNVDELARRFCRTKTSIYRIVNEMRAQQILSLSLDFIPNEMFEKPNADKLILGEFPAAQEAEKKVRLPSGLPPYLASLYEVPLLTRDQEVYLFRKMNYLKFKAAQLTKNLDPARARSSTLDQIERFYNEAVQTKNRIIRANLRLVVSIAKRHVGQRDNLFELISDGNMSLIRAVEKFDFARGNKFSTYASWAIMKNFARTIPDELKHRDRFRTSQEEAFQGSEDVRSDQYEQESVQFQRQWQVGRMLERLDEREQKIIISRFGLNRGNEPLTLKEVGAEMGVTKERVRQIEARALSKLRQVLEEEPIEFMEVD